MSAALFTRMDSGSYRASELTQSPWDPAAQHGGPPAALLAGVVEQTPGNTDNVARVTIDILGPIPIGDLEVTTEIVRPGRRIELIGATLRSGDRVVATASAWRFARDSIHLPDNTHTPRLARSAEEAEDAGVDLGGRFAGEAVEIRIVDGSLAEPGPADGWFRLRVPVVDGEDTTPLQRAACASDFANGLSSIVPFDDYLYINTDVTVNLHRTPVGEWIGLSATSVLGSDGRGHSSAVLHDEHGAFGRSGQTLLVAHR